MIISLIEAKVNLENVSENTLNLADKKSNLKLHLVAVSGLSIISQGLRRQIGFAQLSCECRFKCSVFSVKNEL